MRGRHSMLRGGNETACGMYMLLAITGRITDIITGGTVTGVYNCQL